jgi:hypothetical protein
MHGVETVVALLVESLSMTTFQVGRRNDDEHKQMQ